MKELNDLVELAERADSLCLLMQNVNPHHILAIDDSFKALEQENILLKQGCENNPLVHEIADWKERAEAAEAEAKKLHAKWQQAEWVISGEQQNVRVLQGRESALNAEILTLRAMIPHDQQQPAAWLVGGWAYHDKRSAERRSAYDNLLMEPLFTRAAPAINLAELLPDAIDPDYELIKRILPTANPDEYACCVGADMWNACLAAILRNIEEKSK